jgi:hypothetical protein
VNNAHSGSYQKNFPLCVPYTFQPALQKRLQMNEEIEKGNYSDLKAIAKDVIDNQEKINHHGKRADAIVKGMLQLSRSSNPVKNQLILINWQMNI